jgi:hypothetical protein
VWRYDIAGLRLAVEVVQKAGVPPDPGQLAKRALPAPSGKEPPLLASHRFNNYAGDPSLTHEPGSLFAHSEKGQGESEKSPAPKHSSKRTGAQRS